MGMIGSAARAAGRLARVVSRPVRRSARSRRGVSVQPYRGYGSASEIFLIGRVMRQYGGAPSGNSFADLGRRFLQRGVSGARLTGTFGAERAEAETDRDGYFRFHIGLGERPPADRCWHTLNLTLQGDDPVEAEGAVFVPPPRSRLVVISDIDDTVVYTGVANKAKMLWHLFMQDAQDRVAFPGTAALLNALHLGRTGDEMNPMLYVSRGPWSIYEILDEFFNRHDIPVGPILFLREWGLTLQSPLPRRAKGHKLALIQNMLELYDTLPFVLIGDSGQRDPEIYARVVEENPGRVAAVYIRDVTRSGIRNAAIAELARRVETAGSTLVVAADSLEMAHHAAEIGLIAPHLQADVRRERREAAAADGAAGD